MKKRLLTAKEEAARKRVKRFFKDLHRYGVYLVNYDVDISSPGDSIYSRVIERYLKSPKSEYDPLVKSADGANAFRPLHVLAFAYLYCKDLMTVQEFRFLQCYIFHPRATIEYQMITWFDDEKNEWVAETDLNYRSYNVIRTVPTREIRADYKNKHKVFPSEIDIWVDCDDITYGDDYINLIKFNRRDWDKSLVNCIQDAENHSFKEWCNFQY